MDVVQTVDRYRQDPEALPDDTLLAGLGAGDRVLAPAFVRRFQRVLFGVALTVLGNAGLAEDVAQQGFERAWRFAGHYDPRRGSVRTWLVGIVHNLAVDTVRARRTVPVDPQQVFDRIGANADLPERRALASDTAARLRRALAELPAEQARAVVLAGALGRTAREVAAAEDIPLGTAKSRIRGGLGKLHTALAEEWGGYG